jgi:CspA family cold shock protein
MTSSAVSTSTVTNSSERFTGRVKWFNNKAGYGFITVTDGPKAGSDIFVHHTSIQVDAQQYKYLVQGEYIEFALSTVSNGAHEFQAGDVSGIKGGKLMCETRHELRTVRTNYKSAQPDQDQEQTVPVFRARGQGPRSQPTTTTPVQTETPDATWSQVTRPKQQSVPREATGRGANSGRGAGPRASGPRASGPRAGRGATTGRGAGPTPRPTKTASTAPTSSA